MAEKNNPLIETFLTVSLFALILLLIGILILLFLGYIYALFFDRFDLFFGVPLQGDVAGISLLLKTVISALLVWLLISYPKKFIWYIRIALVFSGYLFVDSLVTARVLETGYRYFSPVLGFFFLFNVILFIIHRTKPADNSP